jgi:hypothetical protein
MPSGSLPPFSGRRSWPYEFFVIVPVNVWLYSAPTRRPDNRLRKLMRDWGLLELGHA